MAKLNQNITFHKGNYGELKVFIEDVSTLIGAEISYAVSVDSDQNTTKLITKTTETDPPGITVDGKIATVIFDPSDTDDSSGISAGEYYHEMRLIDASGKPYTPFTGTINLKPVIIKS